MSALRPELFDVAMASALATSPAASLAAVLGADGALRELGDEFDAAWRAERATAGRPGAQLRANCERIARQILASRARTADGAKVKIRCILWAHANGRVDLVSDLPDTPDLRAALAALRGVLARA